MESVHYQTLPWLLGRDSFKLHWWHRMRHVNKPDVKPASCNTPPVWNIHQKFLMKLSLGSWALRTDFSVLKRAWGVVRARNNKLRENVCSSSFYNIKIWKRHFFHPCSALLHEYHHLTMALMWPLDAWFFKAAAKSKSNLAFRITLKC